MHCAASERDNQIEFNPDNAWDERENVFRMSNKIVRTSNVTQSAVGYKDGLWATVFAACDQSVPYRSSIEHFSKAVCDLSDNGVQRSKYDAFASGRR